MPIEGSPKKLAEDISNGLVNVNKASLRKYNPQDLKKIYSNLQVVLREVRSAFVETNDFDAVKKKNYRMQKINQAILIISTHCKILRIPL